jgi:hypothetical protein
MQHLVDPIAVVHAVRVIHRIPDQVTRNKVAIDLAEALHEAGIAFNELPVGRVRPQRVH